MPGDVVRVRSTPSEPRVAISMHLDGLSKVPVNGPEEPLYNTGEDAATRTGGGSHSRQVTRRGLSGFLETPA